MTTYLKRLPDFSQTSNIFFYGDSERICFSRFKVILGFISQWELRADTFPPVQSEKHVGISSSSEFVCCANAHFKFCKEMSTIKWTSNIEELATHNSEIG